MSEKRKKPFPKVVSLRSKEVPSPALPMHYGTIVGWSAEEGLLVDYAANQLGPRAAKTTVRLTAAERDALIASQDAVLLLFTDEGQPIVMGLTQPIAVAADLSPEALDGKLASLRASERIELRCGKASLVLTSEGKVIVNGTLVSLNSIGAFRIRGGSVDIN